MSSLAENVALMAANWRGAAQLALEEAPGSGVASALETCANMADDAVRQADPPLTDEQIVWLARLVRMEIRKRQRSVDNFVPWPGQDPAEAAEVLAGFRRQAAYAREMLGILADLTEDPGTWRANAVAELPLDEEENQ